MKRDRAGNLLNAALGIALIAALTACVTASPMRRTQPGPGALPASIGNSEFWGIVAEFSEEGGDFPSDNFTSNETSVGFLAGELLSGNNKGGAYIGVGPEQNFTYIAALRPQIAFIVDIRRQAIVQHLMYKALFELSRSRTEFIARLFSKPLQSVFDANSSITEMWDAYLNVATDSMQYERNLADVKRHLLRTRDGGFVLTDEDMDYLAYVYGAFFRLGPTISYSGFSRSGHSMPFANFVSLTTATTAYGASATFLGTEEAFRFVRNMHERNLIIPVVGDFAGSLALRSIAEYLRYHKTPVKAFYVSNVEQYLFEPSDAWRQFYSNVETLPREASSLFIRPDLGAMHGGPADRRPRDLTQSNIASFPPVVVDGANPGPPVVDATPIAVSPPPVTPLCPIAEFLAAYREGRVQSFADATRCAS